MVLKKDINKLFLNGRTHPVDGFIFSAVIDGMVSSCWIELYDSSSTTDGIRTIVFEDISGNKHIPNFTERWITLLTNQVLIPLRWCNENDIISKETLRFLYRSYHDQIARYCEYDVNMIIKNFTSKDYVENNNSFVSFSLKH